MLSTIVIKYVYVITCFILDVYQDRGVLNLQVLTALDYLFVKLDCVEGQSLQKKGWLHQTNCSLGLLPA